jgi:hypothetical protein
MEEVRLWRLSDAKSAAPKAVPVGSVDATATEELLERILADSPDLLMESLVIVGRQNDTDSGPLDLLGVDEDGRLVVFELKRGKLMRDAVAQVLDYASCLSAMSAEELNAHVTEMSGRHGIEKIGSFSEWYRANFPNRSLSDIGKPRMVLVGLGVDATTKRMVEFLADNNVDISLITFYGFLENGQTLLARQVQVEARDQRQDVGVKAANEEKLRERLHQFGLEGPYTELTSMLRAELGNVFSVWPNSGGHTYYFPEQTESGTPTSRAYVGFNVPESLGKARKIAVTLQQRAVNAIGKEALNELAKQFHVSVALKPSGYAEIILDAKRPTSDFKEAMATLGAAILRSWKKRGADSGEPG